MRNTMKKISIVIPLFNEAESLPELMKAIAVVMEELSYDYEVLFIDDGSSDDSFMVCKKLHEEYAGHIKVFRFSRNCGKSDALSAGIERAVGDIIITMDADLQDDPKSIPEMVRKIEEGWDVVSGWKKKRFDPLFTKNIPSKLFNFVTSVTSGLKLHDFNCGFKAYRACAAKSLEIYGERHRYLPVLAHWNGYRVGELVVTHHRRKYGKTKYGLNRFLNGLFDLLTLLFLRKYLANPLHFFGVLGILFGLAGTGVLGYFGVQWIISREMHIRPLVLLSMGSIIMGIQFFSIGLVGEMITNTQRKNTFTIREELE
jgi:glycosyltransferase involved in cell wall biosynthesis